MTFYSISARKAIDIGDTVVDEEEVEDADPCEYVSEVGKSKLSHEFAVSDIIGRTVGWRPCQTPV